MTSKKSKSNTDELAPELLQQYIERIERLNNERADIMDATRDVYKEAKGSGFEPKVMRQIIRLRRLAEHERTEEETLLDLYKNTLNM